MRVFLIIIIVLNVFFALANVMAYACLSQALYNLAVALFNVIGAVFGTLVFLFITKET